MSFAKKLIVIILVALVISLVYVFISLHYELKYPENERYSRHNCKVQMKEIVVALLTFLERNDGVMPKDFYELISTQYFGKELLVCPSKRVAAQKAGFLEPDCPIYVSSYILLFPGGKFTDIPDSAVVVKEFEGNHPESVVSGETFPLGYHVITKQGESLRVEFRTIQQSSQQQIPQSSKQE